MFDLGFAEMVVIAIVALVVIGPERLPTVARKAGMYFARMRRFVTNVKADVEREFRTDELQRMLQQQQEELQSLKEVVNDTRNDVDLGCIAETLQQTGKEVAEAARIDQDAPAAAAGTPESASPEPATKSRS